MSRVVDASPPQSALQAIGYRVGQQMVERVSRERALLSEPLEIMKFICKELWPEVFQKSIDNLRTNHRCCMVDGKHGRYRRKSAPLLSRL